MHINAQNIRLYGCDMYADGMIFMKLDGPTGICTLIDSITGIKAINPNSSTYDQDWDAYMISGLDQSYTKKVFVIDTAGAITSALSPPANYNTFEYQYDMKNLTMYAFRAKTNGDSLYFISLDYNFNAHPICYLDNLISNVAIATNCINSKNAKYYFAGKDNSNYKRFYCISANDSVLICDSLLGNSILSELEYDEPHDKIYGLYKNELDPMHKLHFVEIDTLSGNHIILNPLNDLYALLTGSSIFDQATGIYMFVGLDTNYDKRFYMINASTGVILSEAILSADISEIEVSNAVFAKSYHPTTSIGEENKSVVEKVVYPNPASDHIFVDKGNSPLSGFYIYDFTGAKVMTCVLERTTTSIDISALSAGIYYYRTSGNGNWESLGGKIIIVR